MPKVSAMRNHRPIRVLIVCGPTAAGKTKLAASLARRFDGELINADSRQMYQGMSVISGKDIEPGSVASLARSVRLKQQMFALVTYDIGGVPIWLYDVVPPDKPLSASHFQLLATSVIDDIISRGKLPIVVGGSGFYLDALFGEIDSLHISPDPTLRSGLARETTAALQQRFAVEDPVRWRDMNMSDRNNSRRLVRAIEVARWKKTHRHTHADHAVFDPFWIGLRVPDEGLLSRIRDRVETRVSSGALKEAALMQNLSHDFPAASAIGLPILLRVLRGELNRTDGIKLWAQEEIRYAKRQMVWFKRQSGICWYDVKEDGINERVENDVREWYT